MGRFSRQERVAGFGSEATRRLRDSSVAVVGAGGLGTVALRYLAGAGVGRIVIIDDDVVSESDLHRQILYTEGDLGEAKALVAAERLRAVDATVQVVPVRERFCEEEAHRLLAGCDLVLGAVDSHAARYQLNRSALRLGLPNLFAAVAGWEGQVCAFSHQGRPCYRCLFPAPPGAGVPSPAEAGVLGPVAGALGALQALLAMRVLAGLPVPWGTMIVLDGARFDARRFVVPPSPTCPECGGGTVDSTRPSR